MCWVSPYDVPEAVRGYYCNNKKCFVIEFKYISPEDIVERKQSSRVTLRIGKNSGRLYAIELDVQSFEAGEVLCRVEVQQALRNVLTHLVQEPVISTRKSNYKFAKDAVEQNESQILQPV